MRDRDLIHGSPAAAAATLARRLAEGREKRAYSPDLAAAWQSLRGHAGRAWNGVSDYAGRAWNGVSDYAGPAAARATTRAALTAGSVDPMLRNTLLGAGGGALLGLGRSFMSDPEEGESRNFAGNMLGGALGGAALGGGLTAAARAYPGLVPGFLREHVGEMPDPSPVRREVTLSDGSRRLLKPNVPASVLTQLRNNTPIPPGLQALGAAALPVADLARANPVTTALGLADLANHSRMGGLPGLRHVLPTRITPEMSTNPAYLTKGLEANPMSLPAQVRDNLLRQPDALEEIARNKAPVDVMWSEPQPKATRYYNPHTGVTTHDHLPPAWTAPPKPADAPKGWRPEPNPWQKIEVDVPPKANVHTLTPAQIGAAMRAGYERVHGKPFDTAGAPGLRRLFGREYPASVPRGVLGSLKGRVVPYTVAQGLDYLGPKFTRWLFGPSQENLIRRWSDPLSGGGS